MCGICGWVAPVGEGVEPEAARLMSSVIRHRGPDGQGEAELAGPGLQGWFGHRRLKVLDLSEAAHQPMIGARGAVLTYNGEIYNFRELRRELSGLGHSFRSSGDTEVVLRAYEQWGEAFVERLDGMFALALWDPERGRLLLARDRAGKKPLFYAVSRGRIAFGSEIKSVLACPFVERRPDWDRLGAFLVFGYVPHPDTLYAGVRQVPPAATVVFDRDGLHAPRAYWSAVPERLDRPGGGGGPARDIRELLTAAVRRRLAADVPLGALLSGGIDSSLVVALMAEAVQEPIHTFSIGFADDRSFDERPHARAVADRFGTRHVDFEVRMDAVGLLDRLLWHHDQPFHDSSAIPTYAVCGLAREQVTVALNGDGGDEVFGGYDRFRAAALAFRLPSRAVRAAQRATRALPVDHGYHSRRRRLERFLEMADAPVQARYQSWISVAEPKLLQELLAPAHLRGDVLESMDRAYAEAEHLPQLDRILFANFRTYLPDDLAPKMDRMSMAHSLETRSPFLDTALVERLARIPARRKIGLRRLKPLLREAFGPTLPDGVWDRPKHGFGVPMGAWFRGELGTLFEDEVLAPGARCAEVLQPQRVRALYAEHRAEQRENGFRLWTVLTLERWLRSLEAPLPEAAPGAPAILDATAT